MELKFEYGTADNPRGHALIYFTTAGDPDGPVRASYAVIMPVKLDMERYIPPFLAGQLKGLSADDMSLVVAPPVPEEVGSYEALQRMAERRGDDILYGGTMGSSGLDPDDLGRAGEIAREYLKLCRLHGVAAATEGDDISAEAPPEIPQSIKEVLSETRPQEELLKEISGLLGKLRYAVEGGDHNEVDAIKRRIESIGRGMPAKLEIDKLVYFGANVSSTAGQLAKLYLERAFSIHNEDYLKVKEIEERIANLDVD